MTEADSDSGFESERIFFAALEIPRDERHEWLRRRCGDDVAMRDEVASLLTAADASRRFLETPASGVIDAAREVSASMADPDSASSRAADSLIGRTVGEFTLQAVIGHGGMGVVYRAQQRQPQRTVALKLVRPGLASASMLRHPGIASVYAAGSADLGFGPQPFVAMELVEGVPLRSWLQTEAPDVSTRVIALVAIADAVQHAHQNGIIHRDLKPENLLVERDGTGKPRPRVLDFGVARLTRDDRPGASNETESGHLVGTLQYMSPEQVRGDPVDTRCDVFALGLIAWEMFAGRAARAFAPGSLSGAVRAVMEDKPSPLHTIVLAVPFDLSMIVAKALEESPARRYGSAGDFAADLARFLRRDPVTARAPTTAYLLMRYASRHRAQVAAVVGIGTTLIVALIVSTALLLRTRTAEQNERERATDSRAVADYVLWTLGLDPNAMRDTPFEGVRRTMLDDLAQHIDQRMSRHPQAQVRVLNLVGESYNTLTEYAVAKAIFERSLAICAASLDRGEPLREAALHGLAAAEFWLAEGDRTKLDHVRALYEEALTIRVAALGRVHSETALTMRHLAATSRGLGRNDAAMRLYRESLAIHEQLHAAGDPLANAVMVASGLNGLATLLRDEGEHAEAETMFARSLAFMRGMQERDRRAVDEARVLRNLGVEQGTNGRIEPARASLMEAESVFRQQLGERNREVAATMVKRAHLEASQGNREVADEIVRAVLQDFELPAGDALRLEADRTREERIKGG
ncbi:MAG: serine/threonine-protein kinase [Phycisphaerae bacterium]|nr:serine/threonine-protein kinase [Phycisphaerae bacterium]